MSYVFSEAPQRVYWEITRACDLACTHCRAEAQPWSAPGEMSTPQAMHVLDELASFGTPKPHVILTGGDPLKRADFLDLLAHAVELGLHVSVSPAATPLLTRERIFGLKKAGVEAMSLSLDGSTAERHDGLRGVPGTFDRTLSTARDTIESGILLQINTLVTTGTMGDLQAIDRLVTELGAQRWSLFFLITVGRGKALGQITPEECEDLFQWVWERSRKPGPITTTTEAPHYRRIVVEHLRAAGHPAEALAQHPLTRGFGIRDGNGVMFIGHDGEINPSGFLPLLAGNAKTDSIVDVYRNSPVFVGLRDPKHFEGKCGRCDFRALCGGSRARAYAATGSPFGSDPLCAYEPA